MLKILHKLQGVLVDLPRWGLLGTLVLAPWVYGSTRPEGKSLLTTCLLVVLGFFLLSLVATLRPPKINGVSATLTVLLLLQGWIMVLNAKQKFEPALFAYIKLPGAISWLPGVVDRTTAESQMLLVTGLIGAFWIANDLAASSRWQTRTWWVISLTGISLVVLGLAQRFTGARAIFWDPTADTGSTFFATYRYHGNAGAFLNMVLPLIAAQAVLTCLRRYSHASMTFWCIAALTTAACTFINVSKAAMAVAAFILAIQACQQSNQFLIEFRNWSKSKLTIIGIVFVVLLLGLIWAFGFDESLTRWIELTSSGTVTSRWLVDQTIFRNALPASGWWGFGPGTFQITFPFFTPTMGDRLAGIWQNAHQDYLQTLMEWGYLGSAGWAALLFGGLGMATVRHLRERRSWNSEVQLFSSACILSTGGVLLHALVDFPLQIPSLQLYTAVLLGFVWNLPNSCGSRKRISKKHSSHRMTAPVLCTARREIRRVGTSEII
jgi:hypothetical protein